MCDEATIKEIFAKFDKDGSGAINPAELVEAFKACLPDADDDTVKAYCAELIHKGDSDGDYKLTYEEFKTGIEKVLAS